MKKILFLVAFFPAISFAETKLDIAKDILLGDQHVKDTFSSMESIFHSQREDVLETFEPSYDMESVPSEFIAMEEQLYLDVSASRVFFVDQKQYEDSIARDLADFLTKDELIELRKLLKHPVFKKLNSINESMMKSSQEFRKNWQQKNAELLEGFLDRSQEISKRKIEYFKQQHSEEL
ncbi:hypothetical protein KUV22_05770 [Microbulbifer agarilyticus]|uniref:hypothetical protein n=1 Tax=Microbulbifer agarilyticus TaxID=260552 RepID=UPI001C9592EF|nr:hypothetical protein [Microbulbifer agarilyticus]MBY6189925.1 hypothetical protein [Microbulbifer agarilyticus]